MTADGRGGDGKGVDPLLAARLKAGQNLPKRFYKAATIGAHGDVPHVLLLDGKPARTPARRLIAFDNPVVAQLVAGEWNAQGDTIDPATMPATRLANTAIDGMAQAAGAVRDEIAAYAGSDLVCYRAEAPELLTTRQGASWDPLLGLARRWGMPLKAAAGVMHVSQDARSLVQARRMLEPIEGMALAAMHVVTTLSGSFVLAMALWRGEIEPDAAWEAAHVDEDWQISLWGEDAEAAARRAYRHGEFNAAVAVILASRPESGAR
ncbi:MAG: ATP12 family chaperone protein [Flavobacteriaceae bacterium]